MEIIQLRQWRQQPQLRELLTMAAEPRSTAALEALLDECEHLTVLTVPGTHGGIRAMAAYRRLDEYAVQVEYLATLPAEQGRGFGRALISRVAQLEESAIVATTDADALGFYCSLGFITGNTVQDRRWPHAERYLCILPHRQLLSSRPKQDPQFEYVDGSSAPGIIQITAPDPHWAQQFTRLSRQIQRALGTQALAIEHVGSTAVAGLPAKPLIDISLLVPDAADEPSYVRQLRQAGFSFWHREPGWYSHRMFKSLPAPGRAEANIHLFSVGSPEHCRMVLYRNWLQEHGFGREAYARIKWKAAEQLNTSTAGTGTVMAYNRLKEPFILGLLEKITAGL